MKTIALYLPQFHEVKENSLWWGKGFTDWDSTKKARPLFSGHYQPHVPLNHNYYDLLVKETMAWQADLAHKYSVDGFCFYHYWFKDAKKMLEKPAENLLLWKDICLPFFFSWANETWARSWSGLSSFNNWSYTDEPKRDLKGNAILLDEKYGIQKDWEEHFLYLFDFFKDDRYIKIDNKPVFMIYYPDEMPCLHQMLKFWNELARKSGFDGIYTICPMYRGIDSLVDATMPFANCTVWGSCVKKRTDSGLTLLSYDECWKKYLSLKMAPNRTTLWCIQPNYDDSPRRGRKGILFDDSSPDKFKDYFSKLYQKSIDAGNPFIFINAWNEWGEGMHLEPDNRDGFKYLEAVKDVVKEYPTKTYISLNATYATDWIQNLSPPMEGQQAREAIKTDLINFYLSGSTFSSFLTKHHFSRIVIYGFGELGNLLYRSLNKENIKVLAVLDRKVSSSCYGIDVFKPEVYIPDCDLIIVTVLKTVDDVVDYLESKTNASVMSLKSFLYECMDFD